MTTGHLKKPYVFAKAEDTSPSTFFKTIYQTFQRAEQAVGGSVDRFYMIGEHTIRLRFAGSALVPFITPALEHLATKPVSIASLTICLWDSVSTGTKMPPPPWASDEYVARGEVLGYNNDHIHTAFNLGTGVLNILDTRLELAIYWIRDARQLTCDERSASLRTILHWGMRNYGRQLVHAGAVGTSKGGVLLTGKGGSGKSTTALVCLHSKLLYVGDDYVLISKEPTPFVYSLYNSAKLDVDHIQRLAHLLPAVSHSERLDTEKALIFLHEHYPNKVTIGFPVRAILSLHITYLPETRIKKASPAESLKALAPSTIFQLPGAGQKDFQNLSEFVKQVPSYVLELGTDLSRIPDKILGLLSED